MFDLHLPFDTEPVHLGFAFNPPARSGDMDLSVDDTMFSDVEANFVSVG